MVASVSKDPSAVERLSEIPLTNSHQIQYTTQHNTNVSDRPLRSKEPIAPTAKQQQPHQHGLWRLSS